MKILQLSLKPPYPKVDGGCVAIAAMTESLLKADQNVKLLTMSTHKHPFNSSKVPNEILQQTGFEAIHIDTRIKPMSAFLNLFSSESYNIQRFYSKAFDARILEILNEDDFDIVQMESIFCAPYLSAIRSVSNTKVIIRTHNVEFEIWEQLAAQDNNPVKQWYLNLLAARLKQYELDVLNKVDGIVSITLEDSSRMKQLGIKVPIETVPIGIDIRKTEIQSINQEHIHLYHLGAMDWAPNVEAIEWFLDEIWSKIEIELPDVKCTLAGRKMPQQLIDRSKGNLTIEPEVDSVSEFTSDKNVAIIPILSGSGMRVKIIEALALGKVVVTTKLGATGIPYREGEHLLIADSAAEFLDKIKYLENHPSKIKEMSNAARKLAEQEFDLNKLSSKLTYFYTNL